jgi:hypothetical protein
MAMGINSVVLLLQLTAAAAKVPVHIPRTVELPALWHVSACLCPY